MKNSINKKPSVDSKKSVKDAASKNDKVKKTRGLSEAQLKYIYRAERTIAKAIPKMF